MLRKLKGYRTYLCLFFGIAGELANFVLTQIPDAADSKWRNGLHLWAGIFMAGAIYFRKVANLDPGPPGLTKIEINHHHGKSHKGK